MLGRCPGSRVVPVAGRERQLGCADRSICCHVHHRGVSPMTNLSPLQPRICFLGHMMQGGMEVSDHLSGKAAP